MSIKSKATPSAKKLLSTVIVASISTFFFLLAVVPTLDYIVTYKWKEQLASEQAKDKKSSTPIDDGATQDEGFSVNHPYQEPDTGGETVPTNAEKKLENYQRAVELTRDISIPLVSVIVPIIAIAVPLYELIIKERHERLAKANDIVRKIFYVGAELSIGYEHHYPVMEVLPKSEEIKKIIRFVFSIPSTIEFPGMGVRVIEANVRFFYSENDYDHKTFGDLYQPINAEIAFAPDLKFAIAISDADQVRVAKRFLATGSVEEKCAIKLRIGIDDWQNVEFSSLIELLIEKRPVENTTTAGIVFLIKQVSTIEVQETTKWRDQNVHK